MAEALLCRWAAGPGELAWQPPPVGHGAALTLGAVLAGPARQAGQAAIHLADIVPKAVVAALAEAGAALSVVVLAADHAVGVAQLGQQAALHILRPDLTHRQRPLDGHLADEPLLRRRPRACGTASSASSCGQHHRHVHHPPWEPTCVLQGTALPRPQRGETERVGGNGAGSACCCPEGWRERGRCERGPVAESPGRGGSASRAFKSAAGISFSSLVRKTSQSHYSFPKGGIRERCKIQEKAAGALWQPRGFLTAELLSFPRQK